MSIVTDVFLLTSLFFDPEDDASVEQSIDQIQTWLREHAAGQTLHQLNNNYDAYGGHKAMQAGVWCGAFNHLDVWEFIEFLKTVDFRDWAQLLYQHEFDEEGFTLVRLREAEKHTDDD